MNRTWGYKIERILFLAVAVVSLLVMVVAGLARKKEKQSRADDAYTIIEQVEYEKIISEDAPTGVINVYTFELPQIVHSDILAFYINHSNIEVYVEGNNVYSLDGINDTFRTSGGTWVKVPLYITDEGKQVQVELYPVYQNYQDKEVDFLIGSEMAIYESILFESLPELFLSLCVILTGAFLVSLALYHTIKRYAGMRLYAVGLLSIFTGIWRITYGRFAYLFLPECTVWLYTLSIISLMIIALAMLNCVELSEDRPIGKKIIQWMSILYCVIYIIQMLLQFLGIYDLREMLIITHVTLIISALVLFVNGISSWISKSLESVRFFRRNYSWILGIGVFADLQLYYFAETSAEMLVTLIMILGFSLLEGIRLLIDFSEQKIRLEEMQNKLKLSRTTTMMSQIRSHFVFNILNAISGMCKYDPEMADDTIVRFARYLRNNIDIMENDKKIPFSVDLRQVEDYVALEQIRFGDKIEFYTDIETDQFMIPPLILQPVVENAIKHGISKKMTNGTIVVRTREMEDHICITVEDDGVGFDMEELDKEKSVGIRNVRFRLEQLVHGHLEITSQPGVGTTATITIPKNGV